MSAVRVLGMVGAEVLALGLSVTADVLGWSLDRFADGAGWLSDVSGEAAETARWYAVATRCAP